MKAKSPEELGKIAVISLALYSPGDADDVGYDEVYHAAYWNSVDLLCERTSQDNYYALLFVRDHSHLDGGERLQFDEMMGKFEKKMGAK